jgi:hypothetical protein
MVPVGNANFPKLTRRARAADAFLVCLATATVSSHAFAKMHVTKQIKECSEILPMLLR